MSEPKGVGSLLDLDDDEDIFGPPAANITDKTSNSGDFPSQAIKDPLSESHKAEKSLEEELFSSALETVDVNDEINLNDDDIDPLTGESDNTNKPKLELTDTNSETNENGVGTPIADTPPLLSTSREESINEDESMNTVDLDDTNKQHTLHSNVAEIGVVHENSASTEPSSPPSIQPTPLPPKAALVQPQAAAAAAVVKSKPRKTHDEEVLDDPHYDIEISVTGYEKRGEGMNAFTAFTVTVKASNVPGFTKHEYSVPRRFSDFLGLHEKLAEKYTHTGRIVPVPPGKSIVGMTKTKMSKGEEDPAASEFLEKRRASLERFVRRIVLHPVLIQDPDVRDFLTLETELPKATSTSALSGAGFKRMVKGFGEAVSKIAYHMEESDSWYEEKQAEIDDLDEAVKKLHSSFESLAHLRKDLASNTEGFCRSMQLLAACEENTALSRAFSQLSETEEKVGLCQADQADKDFFIMAENLKDYIGLIASVKEVFYERVKVWNKWQDAQKLLTAKREAKTRFELQGKTDKLPNAKREVQETEEKVAECEEEFDRISKMIRKEVKRFDLQRVKDMKASLVQYLTALALTQQQLVKYWEAFLPEAKQIIL